MPIEKRAGDWTDEQPWEDGQKRRHAGKPGRTIDGEREQHDGHADHRLADSRQLHAEEDSTD